MNDKPSSSVDPTYPTHPTLQSRAGTRRVRDHHHPMVGRDHRRRSSGSSTGVDQGGSTSSSSTASSGSRDRRRKTEQVFFPPFEESTGTSSSGLDSNDGTDGKTEEPLRYHHQHGWAKLLSQQGQPQPRPPRSTISGLSRSNTLNHRRTQSSTDIPHVTPREPLKPSGFSLNTIDHPPGPSKLPSTTPISPLTRSARKMLNVGNENGMTSPTEECSGGAGLVEVIRLDSLNKVGLGECSGRALQQDERVSVGGSRPVRPYPIDSHVHVEPRLAKPSSVHYLADGSKQAESVIGRPRQ
jgi:hypothetical protein